MSLYVLQLDPIFKRQIYKIKVGIAQFEINAFKIYQGNILDS